MPLKNKFQQPTWPLKQVIKGLPTSKNFKINKNIITIFEGIPTLKIRFSLLEEHTHTHTHIYIYICMYVFKKWRITFIVVTFPLGHINGDVIIFISSFKIYMCVYSSLNFSSLYLKNKNKNKNNFFSLFVHTHCDNSLILHIYIIIRKPYHTYFELIHAFYSWFWNNAE